jgi:hypothetical protein
MAMAALKEAGPGPAWLWLLSPGFQVFCHEIDKGPELWRHLPGCRPQHVELLVIFDMPFEQTHQPTIGDFLPHRERRQAGNAVACER